MKKSFLLILGAVMLCANQLCAQTSGTINGYEWVDLGLGVKWATCNVGANKPEQYGDYYQWGAITPNGDYATVSDISGKQEYDAATANWGEGWRMPTKEEFDKLLDENNCTWIWTNRNGVNGYKVTSKKNGNSIFLPAAGCRGGGGTSYAGSRGYYWGSSSDYLGRVCYLYFFTYGGRIAGYSGRDYGVPVRPVVAE